MYYLNKHRGADAMTKKERMNEIMEIAIMETAAHPENYNALSYKAAIGYMMLATKYLGLSRDDTTQLKQLMINMMDAFSHKDAERIYIHQ